MVLAGRLKSAAVRPPTKQPDEATRANIVQALARVGMLRHAQGTESAMLIA